MFSRIFKNFVVVPPLKSTTDKLLGDIQTDVTDINDFNQAVTDAILKAAALSIPRGCRKQYQPFWNPDLETAVKDREAARKCFEESPTTPNKIAYNRASAKN